MVKWSNIWLTKCPSPLFFNVQHEQIHLVIKYNCDLCKYKSKTKEKFDKHKRLVHLNMNKTKRDYTGKFLCNTYEYKADTLTIADIHKRVKLRFHCDDCGKSVVGKSNFKEHVDSHKGIKPQ